MSTLSLISSIACLSLPALPDIRVELIPSNPGPYVGGEAFTVDVWLHSELSDDVALARVRFDFENSDSLELGPQFTFDFSALESGSNFYQTNPNLPRPETDNNLLCFCHLQLPAGGSIPIGSLPLRLPPKAGTYRVDSLNSIATDEDYGAYLEIWAPSYAAEL